MTAAQRVGLIVAIFLALPFLLLYSALAEALTSACLRPFHGSAVAMPHLAENLSRVFWLAVQCLPLLVWKSWRDVGSLRLRWSWTVVIPMILVFLHLGQFRGWPGSHPWTGTLDALWHTLLIAANEELIFRGYAFHDRPGLRPRLTVLASSVAFALFHYVNLMHDNLRGVSTQVGIAFFLGLNLGTVRLATGSLGWCVLIHWFIDAGHDLGGRDSELSILIALVALPLYLVLTLIVFCAHPALRGASTVLRSPAPAATRFWSARRVFAALFGLVGGLAVLLALVVPFTSWLDPAQRTVAAVALVGLVGLPCGMLAVAIVYWRRWQARETRAATPILGQPLEMSLPGRQAVKTGSTLLFSVTLLVVLMVAVLLSSSNLSFSPDARIGVWRTVGRDILPLGCCALTVLAPPCLAGFSLWTALRPRSTRSTTAVWIFAVIFYGFLTWLAMVYVHSDFTWFKVLKVSLWHLAAAGLVAALFLAIRGLFQTGRFDATPSVRV